MMGNRGHAKGTKNQRNGKHLSAGGGENPQTPPPGDRDEGRDTLGDKPWVVKAKGNVVLGGDRPEQRGDRNFSVT